MLQTTVVFRMQSFNSFLYIGKEEAHKYMQYEISMTVFFDRIGNQGKVPKWLSFENYKSLNI